LRRAARPPVAFYVMTAIAEQTIETLEFPKIRAQLAQYTAFSASRELALALQPETTTTVVRRALDWTSEARLLLETYADLTIGGARDVRRHVRHAERSGVLDGAALLEVSGTLASMRVLGTRLRKLDPTHYPIFVEYGGLLPAFPALEEAIEHAIGDDGTVLDSASATLARLRRDVRIAFDRLQDKLQGLICQLGGTTLQEPIITVRNGRYVVPVKAAQRRNVRGLVHDQSSSGATLYIEPMAVVELNNRWRELQAAEEEEVARILADLSDRVGSEAAAIAAAVETLAEIDLALARARYANVLRACAPEIVDWSVDAGIRSELSAPDTGDQAIPDGVPLYLREARHPLLDQQTVVPTTLWLGGDFRLLLITGPNTGGKTVALKTTGLLALMAQAGLHIPAAAPSRLPVFRHVFADIGDEQSIEQSLSTFSSHMRTIIAVLQALAAIEPDSASVDWDNYDLIDLDRPPALVLFDELGAGTDPVEGAALARAIIERLLDLGVLGVATTHYAELKAFAYATVGVQNGSVEFDVDTLAPTYRLSIGLPGRSNALAIAGRLGLDPQIIEQARVSLPSDDAQVEDLLAGIHREREASAAALQRAEELREDAEKYRDRLEQELATFHATREAEAEAAQRQLEDELREARNQLRRLRDDFRSVSLSRQWLEQAEQRLQATNEQARESMERMRPKAPVQAAAPVQAPRPLQVGDTVLVRSVGLKGEIVSIDQEDETAAVQVGGFRMTVELRELQREKREPERRNYRQEPQVRVPSAPDVSMTFDMRGWRAGEVTDRLDRYLNDAYLAGLRQVRLVHGKGTGALRQVVRDVLGGHPLVVSFSGGGRDGGEGVTVATLVDR
jgi:DNA mismatch repair protein MutS2